MDHRRVLSCPPWWGRRIVAIVCLCATLVAGRANAANGPYSPEVVQRLIFYGIQIAELIALNIQVGIRKGLLEDRDEQEADMAKWKHLRYADDHGVSIGDLIQKVNTDLYIKRVGNYVTNLKGTGGYGAVFSGPGAVTAEGALHSDVYRKRVGEWRERVKKIVSDNDLAFDDVRSSQNDIKGALDDAREAYGRTETINAAAFLDALAGAEMVKLNADLDRRLSLETEIEMNEQQERSDELAAFAVAVGAWIGPTAPGGSY